jgi:dTDP-4-amino-4,6-dideoxygalactose transaminase
VVLPRQLPRADVLAQLNQRGVNAVFHYVPLHQSQGGKRFAREATTMAVTEDVSARLIRLPLWVGMDAGMIERIVGELSVAVSAGAALTFASSSARIPHH